MEVVDTLQQNTLGNPRKAGVEAEDKVDNLEAAVVGSLRKVEQKGIQMGVGVGVDKERHTLLFQQYKKMNKKRNKG